MDEDFKLNCWMTYDKETETQTYHMEADIRIGIAPLMCNADNKSIYQYKRPHWLKRCRWWILQQWWNIKYKFQKDDWDE